MSYDPNFFNRPDEDEPSDFETDAPVQQPRSAPPTNNTGDTSFDGSDFFAGTPTYSSSIEAFDTEFSQSYQSQPTQALPHVGQPLSQQTGNYPYPDSQQYVREQQMAEAQAQVSLSDPGETETKSDRAMALVIVEWIIVFAGAIFLAFVIRSFLLQAFWIPSPSMTDTLMVGDRILVNKINYRISDIERFDVVVFKNPDPTDENEELVKRVIGLPGETFEMRAGEVFINGTSIGEEPYVADSTLDTMTFSQVTVPDDSYFVLGDNRSNSSDSRSSLGPINRDLVVGKAFLKFYPFDRIGRVQ